MFNLRYGIFMFFAWLIHIGRRKVPALLLAGLLLALLAGPVAARRLQAHSSNLTLVTGANLPAANHHDQMRTAEYSLPLHTTKRPLFQAANRANAPFEISRLTNITSIAHNNGDEYLSTSIISATAVSTAPVKQSISPTSNSHTASKMTTVSITYDLDMDIATVNTQTFAIYAMETGQLTQTYSVTGGQIILSPVNSFKPGELVQVSATTGTLSLDISSGSISTLETSGVGPAKPTVWQFRAAAGSGPGIFTDSGQSLGTDNSQDVALGDLDGDGDLDAFVANNGQANTVWRNNGSGIFTNSGQSLGSDNSQGVALGDLDGDGDLDAFVANDGQANKVWRNNGSGIFTDSGQTLGSADSQDVALGDVDGDGDLDAFVANDVANKVWLNNGSGAFTSSSQNLGSANSQGVALGDLDNDGDLDAFVANSTANKVWRNDGSGAFTDSGQSLGSANSQDVALGDVDGDGDLDAFIANSSTNKIWRNNGSGAFTDSGQTLGSDNSFSVSLGDIEGDGDLDAWVANSSANTIWLNNGSGAFTDSDQSLDDVESNSLDLGDLDGDGDLDAFVANAGTVSVSGIVVINSTPPGNKVWLNAVAEVELSKSVTPTYVYPGGVVTYTLTFVNNGPDTATGVVITDTMPVSLTNISVISSGATITPTGTPPTYVWQLEDLAAHQKGIITITGQITAAVTGDILTNTAEITTFFPIDTNLSNNLDSALVTVGGPFFMPVLMKDYEMLPDLLITDLQASSTAVTITFVNTGTASVVDSFWIDVYFDLDAPPSVNQPWPTTDASHGVVWGLSGSDLPIMPGESRTLTLADATPFFNGQQVTSDPPYPVGVDVYGYIDSVEAGSSFGAIKESNEANNVFGPVTSGVSGGSTSSVRPQQTLIEKRMPAR